jgi:hypothetical protein
MGEAAHIRAQDFPWSNSGDRVLRVIRELAGEPAHDAGAQPATRPAPPAVSETQGGR